MRETQLRILIRTTAWILWMLAVGFAAHQCWQQGAPPTTDLFGRALLALTAWACLRTKRPGVIDLSGASLLALLVTWPDAWTLALGLLVLSSATLGTRPKRSFAETAAATLAWTLAYAALTVAPLSGVEPYPLRLTLALLIGGSTYEISLSLLRVSLLVLEPSSRRPQGGAIWLNPSIAWTLAIAAWFAQSSLGLAAAPLTVAAQFLLVRLDRVKSELRSARRDLDLRTAELSTLHAVGRELLARPDVGRFGPLLDRECRKLFDPIAFNLLLIDGDDLRSVYRREAERIEATGAPACEALVRWLREEKRSRKWSAKANGLRYRPVSRFAHSALIAPLLVEDRVEGALIVESRQADRYDQHQLAVLTTLAQQAAASLESTNQHRRATVDSLTGFFLREYFFNRLKEEQRRSKRYGGRFALLMIDLDNFKSINDSHGHLAGDRYLRSAAATVRDQLRGADMPCRYGGDEFSLLLPETDLRGASTIAERIRAAISALTVEVDGVSVRGTVSIGFATFPEQETEDVEGLMQFADEALYRAKRAGRNRVVPYSLTRGVVSALGQI